MSFQNHPSTSSGCNPNLKMKSILKITLVFFCSTISLAFARPPQELKFESLKFVPPKIEKRILANGTTLFLLPDHELPLIRMTAYIRTGTMYDDAEKVGVASLCGTLMRGGGTKSKKVEEIDEELEFLGASVETGMDTEAASASLFALKKDLDHVLEIFADVLMNPAFDKKKLEIEKAKIIESIRRRNDEPYQIARREFRKLIYGNAHPLSRTMEIPAVKKISRKELVEFYKKYFYPNNMMIAISGDFETDEMTQKIAAIFGDWKSSDIMFPIVATVKPVAKNGNTVGYAEKSLNQASIILGHLGIKRHNPDRFALEVMNEILGGSSFTSRLFKAVRTRQGLAYWVGSSFSEPWDYGTIAAGCQTKSQSVRQAVNSIVEEMKKMKENEVPDEELKMAKDTIVNSFIFRYASSHAIVTQKMVLGYYGYPEDYLDTYTQKISKITSKDILNVAQKYLSPDALNIMVVGNEKDFGMPLSELGKVRTIDLKIPE